MAELYYTSGENLLFKPLPAKQFRGTHVPDSVLLYCTSPLVEILLSTYSARLIELSYRSFEAMEPLTLNVREEQKFFRFEMVLMGELEIHYTDNRIVTLLAGQYHLVQEDHYQLKFKGVSKCVYFCVSFSSQIVSEMEIAALPMVSPRPLPVIIREQVFELLQNPYANNFRPMYYENAVREMLFRHLATPVVVVEGELTEKELAAIWEADRIIADDLSRHWSIPELARKVNTNAFILKKGFQQLFGTGVFGRLLQRRMDRAKELLEKTSLSILDVSQLAGYDTVAGFITSFRKRFEVTPREWRRMRQ
jgi:AraC-like DNA-binding protein